MTTKHTPTPWKTGTLEPGNGAGRYMLTGGKSYQIGEVSNFNGHEQNAANAAFIVSAVNHHAALVRAVEALLFNGGDEQERARAAATLLLIRRSEAA